LNKKIEKIQQTKKQKLAVNINVQVLLQ